MKQEFNPFDSIVGIQDPEELARNQAEQVEIHNRMDYLIHQVFEQNKAGKELLSLWKDALLLNPVVTPNETQFGAGIEQGKKDFIRLILLTIKKVEADE